MLQRHAVRPLQEDAQLGLFQRLRRGQRDGIFLPLRRGDVHLLLGKLLTLVHRTFIDELHADGRHAFRRIAEAQPVLAAFWLQSYEKLRAK